MSSVNKKYLVVKGCAGLGNRLFTICSAIEYCKKTNRILLVDWADGQFDEKGKNIFNAFFEIKNLDSITDFSEIKNIDHLSFYPAIWKKDYRNNHYSFFLENSKSTFLRIPKNILPKGRLRMIHGYWFESENGRKKIPGNPLTHLLGILSKKNYPYGGDLSYNISEDVLFFADFKPSYSEQTFLKHIFLKSGLQSKIDAFAQENNLSKNTIGVHVRSTDKKPGKQIETLFEKIESLNLKDPQLFVATDNKQVLDQMKSRYKVIAYEKMYPDVKGEGIHQWALFNNQLKYAAEIMEASIMDMWLLGKCEYLFYQSNSSFSLISKLLHTDKNKSFNWDE